MQTLALEFQLFATLYEIGMMVALIAYMLTNGGIQLRHILAWPFYLPKVALFLVRKAYRKFIH